MARTKMPVLITGQDTGKKVVYYFVGFFLVFYLSMLIGSAWVPDCSLLEWYHNFNQFVLVEMHFFVGFTDMTWKVIFILEGVWSLGYLYFITKIQHPFRGQEYGHAKWGKPERFSKVFANKDERYVVKVNFGDLAHLEPEGGVYVNTHNYWLAEGVYLSIDNKLTSNLNIEILGPPGTGKTFRIARAFLAMLAGNFFVTDVKGELSQQTGQYMEDNGYGVFVLNIESEETMPNGCHFNPFPYIENESDILGLCEILFKATKNPDASNNDSPFFEDMAQVLLTCIFYLMFYTYTKEEQDWRHFVELLNSTAVKQDPMTGGIDLSDPNHFMNRYKEANRRWKEKHGCNLKGYEDVEKIYTGAQETSSSIVASLDAHCKFMKLDCVIDLLSKDDLDILNTFGRCKKSKSGSRNSRYSKTGKYILYIVTSENKRYYDWILSMVYSLCIDKLYHLCGTDPALHQTLPEHLTFLMDEFANATLPDTIVELSSTMRSRGMSLVPIVQNLYQYKTKFPKDDKDKNFRSNMAVKVILGAPNDMETCEQMSKEFGKMTINKQTTGLSRGSQGSYSENEDVMEKPLFPAEDIMAMKKNGPLAMRLAETDPLLVEKVQLQNSPLCPLLTREIPYKPKQRIQTGKVKIERDKPYLEQLPTFLCGKEAEAFLKQCEEEDIVVITIKEEALDSVAALDSHNIPIPGRNASTNAYWNQIAESTVRMVEDIKRNSLDMDSYTMEQLMIVQKLRNIGFEPIQINALDKLIRMNCTLEELQTYFGTHMSHIEISDFAERLYAAKKKE